MQPYQTTGYIGIRLVRSLAVRAVPVARASLTQPTNKIIVLWPIVDSLNTVLPFPHIRVADTYQHIDYIINYFSVFRDVC